MKSKSTSDLTEEFVEQCKANFFNDIRPANPATTRSPEHNAVIAIARDFFNRGDVTALQLLLGKSQYFVDLWSAHMLLEHGQLDEDLKKKSTDVIKRYARGCMNPEVIAEEKSWLAAHDMGN
ncbi:MAG TPA: hypothetical protein VL547_22020 [Dinghuibacter sp.]|jgi:hypothetical protein|uniref:hypothetical protein n=1 Tax=Dinghuibacter sp. TaxID=2024697 RepID=UPI002BA0E8A7|nr:hypothetical protein [Dinghuibacter sp.]HTJ14738.1 hypothetical protein [Dinghuibacter sp.]